jgi:hypothetical protein
MSGSHPSKRIGDAMMARFALSCKTVDETIIVNGTLVHGRASVAFIEHAGAVASIDAIKRADELVAAAIEQVYRYD